VIVDPVTFRTLAKTSCPNCCVTSDSELYATRASFVLSHQTSPGLCAGADTVVSYCDSGIGLGYGDSSAQRPAPRSVAKTPDVWSDCARYIRLFVCTTSPET